MILVANSNILRGHLTLWVYSGSYRISISSEQFPRLGLTIIDPMPAKPKLATLHILGSTSFDPNTAIARLPACLAP